MNLTRKIDSSITGPLEANLLFPRTTLEALLPFQVMVAFPQRM